MTRSVWIGIACTLLLLLELGNVNADPYAGVNIPVNESLSFSSYEEDGEILLLDKNHKLNKLLIVLNNHFGFTRKIKVYRAVGVKNLSIFIHDRSYFIAASENFLDGIYESKGSNWRVHALLAHELGHFVNNDLLFDGERRLEELLADKFAGNVLYKWGASKQQVERAYKGLVLDNPTNGYPTRNDRLDAVKAGWEHAAEYCPKCRNILKKARKMSTVEEEPLRAKYPFDFGFWITNFHASINEYYKVDGGFRKQSKLILALRNEGENALRKIILSHFDYTNLERLSIKVWKVPKDGLPDLLTDVLPYRKFQKIKNPGTKHRILSELADKLYIEGDNQIDRAEYKVNDAGELEEVVESKRGAISVLRGKDTVRFSDLRKTIDPGESVIVVMLFKGKIVELSKFIEEPTSTGHLAPYPARISLVGILIDDKLPFKLFNSAQSVNLEGADEISDYEDSSYAHSNKVMIVDHNFIPQHARQTLSWDWIREN